MPWITAQKDETCDACGENIPEESWCFKNGRDIYCKTCYWGDC